MNIARCALYKYATCLPFTSGKRLPSFLNKKLGFTTFLLPFSNSENYSFLFLFHNTTKKGVHSKTHRSWQSLFHRKNRKYLQVIEQPHCSRDASHLTIFSIEEPATRDLPEVLLLCEILILFKPLVYQSLSSALSHLKQWRVMWTWPHQRAANTASLVDITKTTPNLVSQVPHDQMIHLEQRASTTFFT